MSKIFSSMSCRFIELKAFSKSIFKITFSLGWGLSIKQRKTCEAKSAPLLVPTPTCRFPYLAWRDSKTWYPAHFADNLRKVLPAIGRSPPSAFFYRNTFRTKEVRAKFERYFLVPSFFVSRRNRSILTHYFEWIEIIHSKIVVAELFGLLGFLALCTKSFLLRFLDVCGDNTRTKPFEILSLYFFENHFWCF